MRVSVGQSSPSAVLEACGAAEERRLQNKVDANEVVMEEEEKG